MSLRYFAISTLLLAGLVFLFEVSAAAVVPDIGAAIQRDKQRGDPELRNWDLKTWTRLALTENAIAGSLAIAFIICALGLLRRKQWARKLFLASSVGVIAFMTASCVHYFDTAGVLHIGLGVALLMFGWWFLFRSRASASFIGFAAARHNESRP